MSCLPQEFVNLSDLLHEKTTTNKYINKYDLIKKILQIGFFFAKTCGEKLYFKIRLGIWL